jgi:hypothetical protein
MSKEKLISHLYKLYAGKHLPGCDCPYTPINESECRCTGPERYLLINSYVEDLQEIGFSETSN